MRKEEGLGLWETEKVKTPYHPSLRHIAFQIDTDNMLSIKEWLEERDIEVSTNFGYPPEKQPLVLPNNPQAHAAIYFKDPDGNSVELIAPLRLDVKEEFNMMTLDEWNKTK